MNFRITVVLFFAIVTGLLACKDKDLPPATSPTTPLMVINATADTINYYLNGTRQNNLSNLFPGGSTGYIGIKTGQQNYQFKKAGGFDYLFGKLFTLDTSRYYSIFIGGETADKAFIKVDPIDSLATILSVDTPIASKSMIRFVNLSPDAGPVRVVISKSDTSRADFDNMSFEMLSGFRSFKGDATSVQVYQTSALNAPKIDTLITFQVGRIYTIFTKGTLNGKGSAAFSVSLITNR